MKTNYTQLLQEAGYGQEDQTFFLTTLELKQTKPAQFAKIGKTADRKFRAMNRNLRDVKVRVEKEAAKAAKVTKFEDKKHVRWTQETVYALDRALAPFLGEGETTTQQIAWKEYVRHLHTHQPVLAMAECKARRHFDRYMQNEVPFLGEAAGGKVVENFDGVAFRDDLYAAMDFEVDVKADWYTTLVPHVVRGEQIAEIRAIIRRDFDKLAKVWFSINK
jgi:hypothetical protein